MRKLILLSALLLVAPAIRSDSPDWLYNWYQGYNEKYFNGELPAKILIDHNLKDDRFMAITDYAGDRYWIRFNQKYEPSPKQSRATLLHEQCHIDLEAIGEFEFEDHGPKWQYCMHKLAEKGAFDDLW